MVIGFILVVGLAIGAVTYFTTRSTRSKFGDFLGAREVENLRKLAVVLSAYRAENAGWSGVQRILARASEVDTDERLLLVNAKGTVVGDSKDKLIGRSVNLGSHDQEMTLNINGRQVGRLIVKKKGENPLAQEFLESVNKSAVIGGLIAGAIAIIIAVFYSKRIVEPIRAITGAAKDIEEGNLGKQVGVESKDEIGELSQSFNEMSSQLEKQEEVRENMVSDVAHELRTPITNLKGYTEAMKEGLIEPDEEMVESIHQEVLLLSRLVDDLQDLSLADAGKLELNKQDISLEDIVVHVTNSYQKRAEDKKIRLSTETISSPMVAADPQRIDQVLRNLIENALKQTEEEGHITVTLKEEANSAKVTVEDDGKGIAKEDLPHIFERFYKVDESRENEGTGLGLTLAKQIIEAHGGEIEVESVEGEGSQFSFTIPFDE